MIHNVCIARYRTNPADPLESRNECTVAGRCMSVIGASPAQENVTNVLLKCHSVA